MNIENAVLIENDFEEILKLARKKKVIIQESDELNRGTEFGVKVKLPNGFKGILVNVVNEDYRKGICIEYLSFDKKKIISTYYDYESGKFGIGETSEYPLTNYGRNIELRKNIWKLNDNGTISEAEALN